VIRSVAPLAIFDGLVSDRTRPPRRLR